MNTRKLAKTAVIAAGYAAITLILAPISFGPVQLRLSEVLTCLPIFMPSSIIGLTLGCVISNMVCGYGMLDIILGSLATLIGALGTRAFRKKPLIAMLCPVLSNALIVGPMLFFAAPESSALLFNVLTVGLGELAACVILGLPLIKILKKKPELFN